MAGRPRKTHVEGKWEVIWRKPRPWGWRRAYLVFVEVKVGQASSYRPPVECHRTLREARTALLRIRKECEDIGPLRSSIIRKVVF